MKSTELSFEKALRFLAPWRLPAGRQGFSGEIFTAETQRRKVSAKTNKDFSGNLRSNYFFGQPQDTVLTKIC